MLGFTPFAFGLLQSAKRLLRRPRSPLGREPLYPSTMSSPYFTGTLVEAVVEMFSCSGEYIGHGLLRSGGIGGKERWVRCNGVTGGRKGQRGEGRGLVLIEWSTGEKKEKKEGEGSAEPQLHPVMLHGSVSCSSTCSTCDINDEVLLLSRACGRSQLLSLPTNLQRLRS